MYFYTRRVHCFNSVCCMCTRHANIGACGCKSPVMKAMMMVIADQPCRLGLIKHWPRLTTATMAPRWLPLWMQDVDGSFPSLNCKAVSVRKLKNENLRHLFWIRPWDGLGLDLCVCTWLDHGEKDYSCPVQKQITETFWWRELHALMTEDNNLYMCGGTG